MEELVDSDPTHQDQSLETLLNIVRVVTDIYSLFEESILHNIKSSCLISFEMAWLCSCRILSRSTYNSRRQWLIVVFTKHEFGLIYISAEANIIHLSGIVLVKVEADQKGHNGVILREQRELLEYSRELST